MSEDPAREEAPELALNKSGRQTTPVTGPGEKRLELLRDDLIENRFVRPTGRIGARGNLSDNSGGLGGPRRCVAPILARPRPSRASVGCEAGTSQWPPRLQFLDRPRPITAQQARQGPAGEQAPLGLGGDDARLGSSGVGAVGFLKPSRSWRPLSARKLVRSST